MSITIHSPPKCETCGDNPATIFDHRTGFTCGENCHLHRLVRRDFSHLSNDMQMGRAAAPAVQQRVRELLAEMADLKPIRPDEVCLECGTGLSPQLSRNGSGQEVWRCPVIGCPATRELVLDWDSGKRVGVKEKNPGDETS